MKETKREAEKAGNAKVPCIGRAWTWGKDIGNKAMNGSQRGRHKRMEITHVGA